MWRLLIILLFVSCTKDNILTIDNTHLLVVDTEVEDWYYEDLEDINVNYVQDTTYIVKYGLDINVTTTKPFADAYRLDKGDITCPIIHSPYSFTYKTDTVGIYTFRIIYH